MRVLPRQKTVGLRIALCCGVGSRNLGASAQGCGLSADCGSGCSGLGIVRVALGRVGRDPLKGR
jgi:hypothetical protein